jgi:pilus assembly protein TadC
VSTAAISVLLAVLAGLLAGDPRAAAVARLRSLRDRRRTPGAAGGLTHSGTDPATWWARVAAVLAGLALVTGRGATAGVLMTLTLALGVPPARRRRAAAADRARLARDLPRAADLTATCLEAGAAPAEALATVAGAIGGPLGVRMQAVATALGHGADLQGLVPIGDGDPLAALLRAIARATATGAPLADTVRDVASDGRERARWQALERARRAGVQAVGPLAACFLPAFVLVGVVPVVAGVARALLAGWA